jgi:hypothetical protein
MEQVEAIQTQPIPEKAPHSGRQLHIKSALHLFNSLITNTINYYCLKRNKIIKNDK